MTPSPNTTTTEPTSIDTVVHLNHRAQHARIAVGELDPTGPRVDVGNRHLLVGDEVVTRRNDRTLHTDRGAIVKNRDHWTIATIHRDGTVTVTGRAGTIRLPADYVAEHVELGYAQTSHATQGRTVDTALLLIDAPTDTAGIYTPMTRGRSTNQAYVVCEENQTPVDVLTQALGREWIDRPAVARLAEANGHPAGTSRWPCLGDLTTDDPPRLHRRRVPGRASTSRDQSIGR